MAGSPNNPDITGQVETHKLVDPSAHKLVPHSKGSSTQIRSDFNPQVLSMQVVTHIFY